MWAMNSSGLQRTKTGSWQEGSSGMSGEDRREGTDAKLQDAWSNNQPETEGE